MKPILSRRLATSITIALCFLFAALPARTARRPRYGGILRVETGVAVSSLDPEVATLTPEQESAKDQIDSLIYESRNANGAFDGAPGRGPFKISTWQPGKQLMLQANDNSAGDRPFVDAVEITMGRPFRDRLLDLELSKIDLAEIPVQEARHAVERGVRISQSQPDELLALVFLDDHASGNRSRRREIIGQAVSVCIDRFSIVTFLLQKVGEPTAALLPQWSSGTSFLFSTSADVPRAKELWAQITPSPNIVLGYDSADTLEQSVAERIVVNAKEAGISLTAVANPANKSAKIDARLIRVRLISPKPAAALNVLLQTLDSAAGPALAGNLLPESASPEEIYKRERATLETFRIVPLVWLPQVYGLSARVRNWTTPATGQSWPLADIWLDTDEKSTDTDKN